MLNVCVAYVVVFIRRRDLMQTPRDPLTDPDTLNIKTKQKKVEFCETLDSPQHSPCHSGLRK